MKTREVFDTAINMQQDKEKEGMVESEKLTIGDVVASFWAKFESARSRTEYSGEVCMKAL